MLIPRRTQLAQAPPLHCFHLWSRMAPGLALLADDKLKVWAQKLLKRLAQSYAVKVQAFALEDAQFHLVLQWVPGESQAWDDAEAVRRWLLAHPPQGKMGTQAEAVAGMGAGLEARVPRVPDAAAIRQKLGSLSMFMKQFKQMLAQKINWENQRRGSIWQGRFHMAPLADASAVAGAMAFVDLRAVVDAGGERPEAEPFTSLHARVGRYQAIYGMNGDALPAQDEAAVYGPEVAQPLRDAAGVEAEAAPPMTPPAMPPVDMPGMVGMGMGGMPMPDMPGMAYPMPTMPMDGAALPPMGDAAMPQPAGPATFWLLALREDAPMFAPSAPKGILSWLPLGKYLKLLDALVAKAKTWPHLPLSAPGRAKAPETPDLESAMGAALAALGLNAAAFAAQWVRVAKLKG